MKSKTFRVVQRVDRNHEIELPVAEGIGILGPMKEEAIADLLFAVGDAVFGNVEARDLAPGQQAGEIVKQEALAHSHVEDAGIVGQVVDLDQRRATISHRPSYLYPP